MALLISLPTLAQSEAKAWASERPAVKEGSCMFPKILERDAIPRRKDFIIVVALIFGANVEKFAGRV